jgi:hypothetical protein
MVIVSRYLKYVLYEVGELKVDMIKPQIGRTTPNSRSRIATNEGHIPG